MEISAGGVLGKPPEGYDLVVRGVADIASIGLPYTPGRFPMASVGDLPVWRPSAEVGYKAFSELKKKGYFDKEFEEVKFLGIAINAPMEFGWAKDPVAEFADFEGKKVRVPGGLYPKMMELLGVTPVSLSAIEVYGALEKGVCDGSLGPKAMIVSFNFQEVMQYWTEVRFSAFMMGHIMNKDSYAKLPKEVQAIIDQNADAMGAAVAARMDSDDTAGRALLVNAGRRIDKFSAADETKMRELWSAFFREWIDKQEAQGQPGEQIVNDLYSIMKGLGVQEPFLVAPK